MGQRTVVYCENCNITLIEGTGMRKKWVVFWNFTFQRLSENFFIRNEKIDFCSKECMLAYFGKMYDNPEDYFAD